jgi:BTB/POZ domain
MPRRRPNPESNWGYIVALPEEPAISDSESDEEVFPVTAFPIPSEQHGSEMMKVCVGSGKAQKVLTIHRNLLARASARFRAAFRNFKEGKENEIEFKHDCPMAFEVLYQYMYSGHVQSTEFYTQSTVPDDVHWFRTLKLADATMVSEVQRISYQRLRKVFNKRKRRVPSITFMNELYDDEAPQHKIREFIVAHSAFCIQNDSKDNWQEWRTLMDEQTEFAAAVGVQLAKTLSSAFTGCKEHPTKDTSFDEEVMFASMSPVPAPAPEDDQVVPDEEKLPEAPNEATLNWQ